MRCGFRGLCARDMGSSILFIFTHGTFFPVAICVLVPIAIAMGDGPCGPADIAVLVTAVIVGMCTKLSNYFCFSCAAGSAGDGLFSSFFAGSLFDNFTAVPCVLHRLVLLANGAGMLVRVIVHFAPRPIAVGVGFRQCFCFCSATGSAGIGFAAGFFTRGLLGYGAAVPRMVYFFYVTAGRTSAAVLGSVAGVATETVIFAVDSDGAG